MSVRPGSAHELFLPDSFSVFQRGHGRPATAHVSLMCALLIVEHQPVIQIPLQGLKVGVQRFPESDRVELVQDRLVKTLANAIGLR